VRPPLRQRREARHQIGIDRKPVPTTGSAVVHFRKKTVLGADDIRSESHESRGSPQIDGRMSLQASR